MTAPTADLAPDIELLTTLPCGHVVVALDPVRHCPLCPPPRPLPCPACEGRGSCADLSWSLYLVTDCRACCGTGLRGDAQ